MQILKILYICWIVFLSIGIIIFIPTIHNLNFHSFCAIILQLIGMFYLPPMLLFNFYHILILRKKDFIMKTLWILLYYPLAFLLYVVLMR